MIIGRFLVEEGKRHWCVFYNPQNRNDGDTFFQAEECRKQKELEL